MRLWLASKSARYLSPARALLEVCMPISNSDSRLFLADRIDLIDHLLTAKELAPMLSCSGTALYGMVRGGRIPHIRFGGSIRFDPHAIAAWLRAREVVVA
jgi:excisionase family DNA binding protein